MRTNEETLMLLNGLSIFTSTWTLLTSPSLGREGWLPNANVNLEERRLLVLTRNDDGPAEVIAAGADLAVPVPVLMLISLADADAAKREAAARQRHESEREKMFFMLVK